MLRTHARMHIQSSYILCRYFYHRSRYDPDTKFKTDGLFLLPVSLWSWYRLRDSYCSSVPNMSTIGLWMTHLLWFNNFSRWPPSAILNCYFFCTPDHPQNALLVQGWSQSLTMIRIVVSQLLNFKYFVDYSREIPTWVHFDFFWRKVTIELRKIHILYWFHSFWCFVSPVPSTGSSYCQLG